MARTTTACCCLRYRLLLVEPGSADMIYGGLTSWRAFVIALFVTAHHSKSFFVKQLQAVGSCTHTLEPDYKAAS